MTTNSCPPVQPCFCPSADLPVGEILVQIGGPANVAVVPIYGTPPFSVQIVTNPILPFTQLPIIASVQVLNGNELTITTVVPAIGEPGGTFNAQLTVCNACGTLTIDLALEVVASIIPIVTGCVLAQGIWTPEARLPAVGDTVLAFTPAGCRALLPPIVPPPIDVCAEIQLFATNNAPLPTDLLVGTRGASCLRFPISEIINLVDTCAHLQAFPVAGVLNPADRLVVLQGAACGLTTFQAIIDAVDLCTQFQNLPNATVQPTASFFGEQGGECRQFLVADLLALATISFPALAPNGSCAAPSYSFTASPDSGMFYDPAGVGSVVIGDDNCADSITVGASIVLATAASQISLLSGANVAIQGTTQVQIASLTSFVGIGSSTSFVNISANTTIDLQASGGNITLAAAAADIDLIAFQNFSVTTGGVSRLRIDNTGAWNLLANPGVVGQALTSSGPGLAPAWANVSVFFPLTGSDGTCAAPTYSFTNDPDSGLWLDRFSGAAPRVVLSDTNCANQLYVGDGGIFGLAQNAFAVAGVGDSITFTAGGAFGAATTGGQINIASGNAPTGAGASLHLIGVAPALGSSFELTGGNAFGAVQGGAGEMRAGASNTGTVLGGGILLGGGTAAGVGGGVSINVGADGTTAQRGNLTIGARNAGSVFHEYFRLVGIGGEWQLAGDPGTAGEVITSGGVGVPPTWASPVVAFPVLAPNGSCAAPSYSFTASPTSGVWFNPAVGPAGAVTISDHNCANLIEVGSSITLTTTASSIFVTSFLNLSMSAAALGILNCGSTLTLTGTTGVAINAPAVAANVVVSATGSFRVNTSGGGTERLEITGAGAWEVNGTPGVAAQVLTSGGAGVPPTWAAVSAAVSLDQVQNAAASATRAHGNNVITWGWSGLPPSDARFIISESASSNGAVLMRVTSTTVGGNFAIPLEVTWPNGGVFRTGGGATTGCAWNASGAAIGQEITLQSGSNTAGNGGGLNLRAGASTGNTGGGAALLAGNGGLGGNVSATGGNSTGSAVTGGDAQVSGGSNTHVAGQRGGSVDLRGGGSTNLPTLQQGNVYINAQLTSAIATTATSGFAYLPRTSGPPTGVPAVAAATGQPFICSISGATVVLHAWDGAAWRSVVLT